MALIAVAGATGHTGARVLNTLARAGVGLRLIGRDAARLARAAEPFTGASRRCVPAWDAPGLARALEGCDAVIACAGPFLRAGWPVARAAVDMRTPYCDSSGEQAFIRRIFDELDAPARESGVALVPAAGFDYLLGDLGCALVAQDLAPLDSLEVIYAVANGGLSEGTRRTMIETLGHAAYAFEDGRLRRIRIASETRRAETPFGIVRCVLIPAGEAIMVPRHVEVRNVRTFAGARGMPAPPALLALLSTAARIRFVRRAIEGLFARTGPRLSGGGTVAPFVCRARAVAVDGRTRVVTLEAADPYDFTARSLAAVAVRLASGKRATGALAPAQVVDAAPFLQGLGVAVSIDE